MVFLEQQIFATDNNNGNKVLEFILIIESSLNSSAFVFVVHH